MTYRSEKNFPSTDHQQCSLTRSVLGPRVEHQQCSLTRAVLGPRVEHQQCSLSSGVLGSGVGHQQCSLSRGGPSAVVLGYSGVQWSQDLPTPDPSAIPGVLTPHSPHIWPIPGNPPLPTPPSLHTSPTPLSPLTYICPSSTGPTLATPTWTAKPPMPLQLSKLRKGKGLKGEGSIKSSTGSLASSASQGEGVCVYVVNKTKDLPKLHRAVWKEDSAKVKSITSSIRKSVLNSYDKNKRTALHLACAKGLADIVLHLCATSKADCNLQDADGATPMHRVIGSCSSAPLQHLLDCGGNPNLANKNGHTPLHVASQMGDAWAVSLLLDRDARIDAIDGIGHTALHEATLHGHLKLSSTLIDDGADINCQDGEGKTCLMMACSKGQIGIVQLLCDNKANAELSDHTSFTALDYAITRNHHDCAQIVEDYRTNKTQSHAHQIGHLVDPALIHASYGVGGAMSAILDGGPAMGHLESPAHSDGTPSIREASPIDDNTWAVSDTEDIIDQFKPSIANKLHAYAPPCGETDEEDHAPHTADEASSNITSSHNSVDLSQDLASHTQPPATPTHTQLPATPTHTQLPATPTHTQLPATPTHTQPPATPTHTKLPTTPTHSHLSPVATPPHGHSHTRDEEEKGVSLSLALSYDGSEVDYDSDISGLLVDGDYVPSNNLGPSSLRGRSSTTPFITGGGVALPSVDTGSVQGKNSGVLQDSGDKNSDVAQDSSDKNSGVLQDSVDKNSGVLQDSIDKNSGVLQDSPSGHGIGHYSDFDSDSDSLPSPTHPSGNMLTQQSSSPTHPADQPSSSPTHPADQPSSSPTHLISHDKTWKSAMEVSLSGSESSSDEGEEIAPIVSHVHSTWATASTARSESNQSRGVFAATARSESNQSGGVFAATARSESNQSRGVFAATARSESNQSRGVFAATARSESNQSGGVFAATARSESNRSGGVFAATARSESNQSGAATARSESNQSGGVFAATARSESNQSTTSSRSESTQNGNVVRDLTDVFERKAKHSVSSVDSPNPEDRGSPSADSPNPGDRGSPSASADSPNPGDRGSPSASADSPNPGDRGSPSASADSPNPGDRGSPSADSPNPGDRGSPSAESQPGRRGRTPAFLTFDEPAAPRSLEQTESPSNILSHDQIQTRSHDRSCEQTASHDQTRSCDHTHTRSHDHSESRSHDLPDSPLLPHDQSSPLLERAPALSASPIDAHQHSQHSPTRNKKVQGDVHSYGFVGGAEMRGVWSKHGLPSLSTTPTSATSVTTPLGGATARPHPSRIIDTDMDTDDASQVSEITVQSHDSRFDNYLKKADHLSAQKCQLEHRVMQLELDNRQLHYETDQARERGKVNDMVRAQLRDKLDQLESRLGMEVEGRQEAELKARESEITMRSLKASQQQLKEERDRVKMQLQAESEARILQEGIYQDQVRVFQSLQLESEKVQDQQNDIQGRLLSMDNARSKAEEKVKELTSLNTRLHVDLAALKQKGEEAERQLEAELDSVKAELLVTKERCVSAETNLLDSQFTFNTNLKELQEKAAMLGSALDREVEGKRGVVDELSRVRAELDRISQEQRELHSSATNRDKTLNQQLTETLRDKAVAESNLKNTRENLSQQHSQLESLQGKLHQSEASSKAFETLATERAHQISSLERECKVWSEQLAAAEEALSSRDAQMRGVEAKVESYVEKVSVLQVEKERLTQQVEFGKRKLEETSNAVLQAQNRFDQLLQSVRGDQHKIGSLEESLGGITGDRKAWQERATNLEVELAQHQDTVRQTEQGKQVLMEEKVVLKGEVSRLEAQVRVQTAEMEAEVAKKKDLVRELEHLSEIRGTLEGLVSTKQEEMLKLQHEVDQMTAAHRKASREAQETRGLWEAEVKTKARLGQELEQLQKVVSESRAESQGLVATERRKTRKALELRKSMAVSVEARDQHCAQLQEEIGTLRSQLKTAKQQIKQLHSKEKHVLETTQLHQEEQATMERELERMRTLLDNTGQQLKREGEARLRDVSKVKQDFELSHSRLNQTQIELNTAQRECSQLEHANRKLKEEVKTLQEHIAEETVPKNRMEAYKKEVEEKARHDLTKKLEEVNAHMDQQSQAQESILRFRNTAESEWRSKYEYACEEVRELKARLSATKEVTGVENSRLKELFEVETRRSEKLSSQLRKSKEEAGQYRTQLNLEQSRTQHFLSSTSAAAASLPSAPSSPPPKHTSFSHLTSTPRRTTVGVVAGEELLSSVRMQLDSSIARHLDRTTAPRNTGKATRPTYTDSKYSPLDSICSNYHI